MDGGYYAIKGFEFQVDKNILEILNETDVNKPINIEQNQDINSDSFIMQVKYKETAKFVPSAIKAPAIQLIDEYKNNNKSIQYILYCFFEDFNGYKENISIDIILGTDKNNYSQSERAGFQNKFELKFAPKFDIQLEQTIKKICELGFDEESAIIHHSRLTQHLRNLVVNNGPDNVGQRTTTKQKCIDLIKKDREVIYTSTYRVYKGDQLYFSKIKSEHFTFRNFDKFVRVVVIETKGTESLPDLKAITLGIKNKFYKSITSDIKGEAPFIYFRNVSEQQLIELKTTLINEGNNLKDGFDFENANFNIKSITIKATKSNQLCLKFINNEAVIGLILNCDLGVAKEMYQFYLSKPLEVQHECKDVKIRIKEINEIMKIL